MTANKVMESHWVALFINKNTAVNFYSFQIGYILQEVLSKIKDKSITHKIFTIQDDDSAMCGFYWIAVIEYIIAWENLCRLYLFIFSEWL